MFCEKITPLTVGEDQKPGAKQIFKLKPHFTYYNYFSGDLIMNYLGENGFGAVTTCRRDCLPSNITSKCFHKLKTYYKQQSKEDRFQHPVLAAKETHTKGGK